MSEDIFGKVPPHSIEAEQATLGSILIDKEAIFKVVDFLQPEHFYRTAHQIIYESIRELFEKNEPIDLLTLSEYLKKKGKLDEVGGFSYLATLTNIAPTALNIEIYAQIVEEKAILREIIKSGIEIINLAFAGEDDVGTILDKSQEILFDIAKKRMVTPFYPLKDLLKESFERIESLYKEKKGISGIPTNFKKLDEILGGFHKNDLLILAARPSIGKTSLSINISVNIALKEKIPVAIFSLEMSKEQIVERILESTANVNFHKLKTSLLSDDDWSRLGRAYGPLYDAPIYIDDSSDISILEIRTKARRLKNTKNLGMIVVDYLQLMHLKTKVENRVQEISELTRGFKKLARELEIPVLVISQLSRAIEKRESKKPMLSDLRESGCLTKDTTLINGDTGELITIKELIERRYKLPIPILSLNEENLKIKKANLVKVFSSGIKRVYLLKTQSGREIKASANHPFLTIDGWKRLDQLEIGEHIATSRIVKIDSKEKYKDEELIFLAHMIGDGCYAPKQPIHYTSSDLENIKIVEKTSRILFNIDSKIIKQKNWYHIYLPSPYHLTHNKHHPFVFWLFKNGLKLSKSYEKELPADLLTIPERQVCLFLKHLWSTDGNISLIKTKKEKSNIKIYYSSTSKKLIQQIQYLHLRLGIISTIRVSNKIGYRSNWNLDIQGKENQLKFLKLIGSYGKRGENINNLILFLHRIKSNPNNDVIPKKVWNYIKIEKENKNYSWRDLSKILSISYSGSSIFNNNLSRERLNRYANILESKYLYNLSNSDIYWDKIKEIKELGEEEVYDVTIDETHNFIANNIIVHNSIEQDADVVMFLNREDDDIGKDVSTVELIVAKNRNGPLGKMNLKFLKNFAKFSEIEYREEEGDEDSF